MSKELPLLVAVLLAMGIAPSFAQNDSLAQEREKVALECRRLAKPLGLANADMEEDARRAKSSAELSSIREECQRALSAYPVPALDQAARSRGHQLYDSLGCRLCHGSDARGGEGGGPSLLRSQRVFRDRDGETIAEVVSNGVPNTRMPAFRLTRQQLSDLATFLHGLQVSYLDAERVERPLVAIGDARMGEVYFSKNCSHCHSVSGDLQGIGSKYQDLKTLQRQWLMPERRGAKSAIVSSGNRPVMAGEISRVDEFLITLTSHDGSRRTIDLTSNKMDLHVTDRLGGHRTLLAQYSDADIHNLTAYLHTLTREVTATPRKMIASRDEAELKPTKWKATAGLPPESIISPVYGSWPTYSGDYSGRRYSSLSQINQSNVRHLSLAWTARFGGSTDRPQYPVKIGGNGKDDQLATTSTEIRGSIIQVGGVLYFSTPDNAWAVDARSGEILWNFRWKSQGGWHFLGSRGPAMYNNSLFFETPDAYLVSLDAQTGDERWHAQIASLNEHYMATVAPIAVPNHILVGVSNGLNAPGFLAAYDPANGHLQWKHYSVPMKANDPGIQTWKDLDAAKHGGGQVWVPGAYDPESHLYIYGTGNPTPAYLPEVRGNGDALFTCSLLAVNVDSGKMVWHYQTSPNDTHDWDSAQTPILADIMQDGGKRKVVMTAARNGYFFVVDRNSGVPLLTKKFSSTANWARTQLNSLRQPVRIPEKDGLREGALVSNNNNGAANWQPPSYSPDYGLFYVQSAESWALYYKTDSDAGGAYSMEGKEEVTIDASSFLKALDPKTGATVWSVKYSNGNSLANGVLTTAGGLLFAGDTGGNLVARDPSNGRALWHAQLGQVSNAPETYMLDDIQYVLVASDNMLFAFRLQ